jgi:Protein of unknown function (DUF3429)
MHVTGSLRGLRQIPTPALALGLAGALPFLIGALLVAQQGGAGAWGAMFLIFYGAVILAFVGGIHWGTAMAQAEPSLERLTVSVLPALVGWVSLAAAGPVGFVIQAVAFAALLAYELWTSRQGWTPGWYPALRWPLTVIVVLCLALAAVTTDLW